MYLVSNGHSSFLSPQVRYDHGLSFQVQVDLNCVLVCWRVDSLQVRVSSVHFSTYSKLLGICWDQTCTDNHQKLHSFVTGLLHVVKQCVKIPVYVMVRPRGGDFLYSDQEVEVMKKDIELMKTHGADGLVLGALTADGRVDAERCMEFLGMPCTPPRLGRGAKPTKKQNKILT